ncbi:MAG: amino acid adenylation domain-containing protein, partial [Bacteroidota bacterium]
VDDYGNDFGLTVKLSDIGIDPSAVVSYIEESLRILLKHVDRGSTTGVPATNIDELSIVSKEERHQLLEVFNDTAVSYPADKTIVDLFEAQAAKTPDAVAVVYEKESLSYQELNERSNQLAHYLVSKGISSDVLVGICLNRSLEMLVGILGILKSGGAYVPIDPEYPQSRIDYMLEDSGVRVVLSSSDCVATFSATDHLDVVLLDSDWKKRIGKHSIRNLKRVASPEHLAYVIYTSGSTGKPKGVLIEHINVIRLFNHDSCLYDFSSDDVWTLFHSFCFDFSVWEMYGALLFGGRLVIVPKSITKDAIALSNLLVEEGVTVLNQTPSFFYALKEEFLSIAEETTIRYVIFGGEALNPSYLASWKSSYPNCQLINMYGITETTVHATYKEITDSDVHHSVSTIGRAIPTLSCYIVDEHLNLVPQGVIGELCIVGSGLARGYLNREALTNERFVLNPFSGDNTSRLYKSGDLARWLPDGNLEYIGRKDDQVKIRGFRIELREIEHTLSLISGITQSCVLAKEDTTGSGSLVAYVVMEGDLDKEALQEELQQRLPEYMVPRLWIQLDEMRLTSSGKIDRKALPALDSSALTTREYVAPRTELEVQLARIWQDLLGVEKVGIYDNFFELGGHSLLIIKLISSVNKLLNAHVKIALLFAHPTLAEFAAHIHVESSFDSDTMVSLRESGDQRPIFLVPEISGTMTSYFELAKSLGDNQPVYAFQSPGLDGESEVSGSVEAMAAMFILEMQKIDPQGPYRLGGYSFGSNVAYEMALQLKREGFEVDELIIFDGKIVSGEATQIKDEDEVFTVFLKSVIKNYGKEFDWTDLVLDGKSMEEQIDEMYKRVTNRFNEMELRGRLKVMFNNFQLLRAYRPKSEEKSETHLTLFKAIYAKREVNGEKVLRDISEFDYGWNRYTNKEVIVHSISADHMTILDKNHVQEITEFLNEQEEMSV